uniref:Serpin domain-containing protein n=1 Tax=Pyramimonas obovata TaxID=1411642 RepID=A0A7S0MXF3_9CHLO|mmetsp:Transcript_15742/g.34105  ORF Transcript_15742/g.34105 Transcript_15742/m.34105 type:complete len:533 (+) Transcript_15742:118-1716(+)
MGNYASTEASPDAQPPSSTGYQAGFEEGYKAAFAAGAAAAAEAAAAAGGTVGFGGPPAKHQNAMVQMMSDDPVRSAEDQYLSMATHEYGKYGLGAPLEAIPVNTTASRMNDFGFRLLHAIDKKNKATGARDGCIVVSPVALATMLGALATGATVESVGGEQLSEALQLPLSCTECVEELGHALREIVAASDPRATMWMPMAVWIATHRNMDYQRFLGECLGVEVRKLGENTGVNDWFDDRSDHTLKDIVPDSEEPRSCCLTSGLFFNGSWACGFCPEDNVREAFTITQRSVRQKVQVPCVMMRKRDTLQYVEVWTNETVSNNTVADPELAMLAPEGMLCQIVEIPYTASYMQPGTSLTAVVVLPHFHVQLSQLIAVLGHSPLRWSHWLSGLRPRKLDLKIPKFTVTNTTTNMMADLQNMGVTEAFSTATEGNLYGMSEDARTHVDGFYHQVRVVIGERGTTMPAKYCEVASAVQKEHQPYARTAGFVVRQMYVDRPFLLFIRDKESGAVLAASKVEHPVFNLDHRMERGHRQ